MPRPQILSKYFTNRSSLSDSDDFKEPPARRPNRKVAERAPPPRAKKKSVPAKSQDVRYSGPADYHPDHLQLAIALSRSVSKESDNNISSTLQQFGFHTNKPRRKAVALNRNCPLINYSPERKHQTVNNIVSQILFENITTGEIFERSDYHLASSILLEQLCPSLCCFMKSGTASTDIENFYAGSIVEKSTNKVGRLLRDWSAIPGREKSPPRITSSHKLPSEQSDLLLSGTFSSILNCVRAAKLKGSSAMDPSSSVYDASPKSNMPIDIVELPSRNMLPSSRSNSPDIFDDSYDYIKHDECRIESDDELPSVHFPCSLKTRNKEPINIIPSVASLRSTDSGICSENSNNCSPVTIKNIEPSVTESHHNVGESTVSVITITAPNNTTTNSDKNGESSELSDVFIISDDELDYSINQTLSMNRLSTKYCNASNEPMQEDGESSVNGVYFQNTASKLYRSSILDTIRSSTSDLRNNSIQDIEENIVSKAIECPVENDKDSSENDSSGARNASMAETRSTPLHEKYEVKTHDVTPKINFNIMDSPEIEKHLSNYGLKPFKRKKAIQLLEHIYKQTHPLVNKNTIGNMMKKRKLDMNAEVQNDFDEKDLYQQDGACIPSEVIEAEADSILPSKSKSKAHGCMINLDTVFHNYVALRSKLREAIVCYEPVDLEVIHRDLKLLGHKFKPADLLTFMDKKCITIKMSSQKLRKEKQKST